MNDLKPMLPIDVAAGVIVSHDKVLLAKRHGGYLDNLWEFPGGKLESGENALAATERELMEELNLSVVPTRKLLILEHTYPDKCIRLHFVLCSLAKENSQTGPLADDVGWFKPDQFPLASFCPADRLATQHIPWQEILSIRE